MKIAVLPGDGIGPEVTAQSVKVLRAVAGNRLDLQMTEAPIGQAGVDAAGVPLPEATMALASSSDAILFGSVGGPTDELPDRSKRPGAGLLKLRKALNLFANFRPAVLFPELIGASTLEAGDRRGRRHDDPARAERRPLFRRAARRASGERQARRHQHHALLGGRDRAHRACRVPGRAAAPAQAVLGRQGQRAGDDAALARGGDGGRARVSGCRAVASVRRRGVDDADPGAAAAST